MRFPALPPPFCCQVVWIFEEDGIEPLGTGPVEGILGRVRGILRLQQFRPADAVRSLRRCRAHLREDGRRDPAQDEAQPGREHRDRRLFGQRVRDDESHESRHLHRQPGGRNPYLPTESVKTLDEKSNDK